MNADSPKRSLADDLKRRRELKEKLSIERMNTTKYRCPSIEGESPLQYSDKVGSHYGRDPMLKNMSYSKNSLTTMFKKVAPTEIDKSGT